MKNNKQALIGTVTSSSNNQNGTRRISVMFDFADYEHEHKDLFNKMFNELPVDIAVAVIDDSVSAKEASERMQ